jgi:hypothetical protein
LEYDSHSTPLYCEYFRCNNLSILV